jgi:hypothetical protein
LIYRKHVNEGDIDEEGAYGIKGRERRDVHVESHQ